MNSHVCVTELRDMLIFSCALRPNTLLPEYTLIVSSPTDHMTLFVDAIGQWLDKLTIVLQWVNIIRLFGVASLQISKP